MKKNINQVKNILIIVFASACQTIFAQVLPDKILTIDPLQIPCNDSSGVSFLNSTRLYAEFARHKNNDKNHLWNAKSGGYIEILRIDSTWSITADGVMEVVMDGYNDIAFNPRAIFWEEGLHFNTRLSEKTALQFGYTHRCKHDIDNLEPLLERGKTQERTLVFSGIMARFLYRPQIFYSFNSFLGRLDLKYAANIRNDLFMHVGDFRNTDDTASYSVGNSVETLINSTNLYSKVIVTPQNSKYSLHLTANLMTSIFGSNKGFTGRFSGEKKFVTSMPLAEIGFNAYNPEGAVFTFFLRHEFRQDAAIVPEPEASDLFMFGIRISDFKSTW